MSKLAERLRESIEEEIATGILVPGARLEELALAARFGVSRTPVREALSQLAGEGLVEPRAGRGMVVTEVRLERVVEMFEVVGELESMCARHCARRMTPQDQQALQQAHAACEAACASGDTDAYYYANEHFHQLIYAGSKNEFLCEQVMSLNRKLRPYRRLQLRVRNRMGRSLQEHAAVLAAILAGDADAAVREMRGHMLIQGERFGDLLAGIRSMSEAPARAALVA